jgi:hypothetical protein
VEARLEAKLAETKAELIKWLVGLLFVQAGFMVAPQLTVVSDVMSDVTSKARRIFNKLQAQHPQ